MVSAKKHVPIVKKRTFYSLPSRSFNHQQTAIDSKQPTRPR